MTDLTIREIAAIRAGLDLYWCHAEDGFDEDAVYNDASNDGAFEPLTANETAALRDRLVENTPSPMETTFRALVQYVLLYDRTLNDPRGDGIGTDAQPPDGDDYNSLFGFVKLAAENASIPFELPAPAAPVYIGHPLPTGTWIESVFGEMDADGNDDERHTGPNAIGRIADVRQQERPQDGDALWHYSVVFPNNTWVWLDCFQIDNGTADPPSMYRILTPE